MKYPEKIKKFIGKIIIAVAISATPLMCSSFQNPADSLHDRYTVSRIIEMVARGEKSIADSRGKDLVIFVGGTQVGKSTTINALLGVPMQYSMDGSIEPIPPAKMIAPVGSLQAGGVSCTEFPALYTMQASSIGDSSRFCFLDTQGFFDVKRDPEMVIASSILMEMAVNQSNSVRLVYLGKFDQFNSGVAEFNRFGEALSDIVVKSKVPMYFLFNRFAPPPNMGYAFYGWGEDQRSRYIQKALKDAGERILKAGEKVKTSALKRILKKSMELGIIAATSDFDSDDNLDDLWSKCSGNISDIIKDTKTLAGLEGDQEIREMEQKTTYLTILKNSLDNGFLGYVDPTSPASLKKFFEDIALLPAVNKSDLVFSGYNRARIQFNQMFEKRLMQQIFPLRKMIFAKQYPESSIENLERQIEESLKRHRSNLNIINQNGISIEIQDEYDHDGAQEELRLLYLINSLMEQEKTIRQRITDFINGPLAPVGGEKWDEHAGIRWWRNHTFEHTHKIPFVSVDEKLGEHTERHKTFIEKSPEYKVEYTSGGTTRRVLAGVACTLISPAGFVALSALSRNCSGEIVLWGRPEDREPQVLPALNSDLKNVQEERANTDANLKKLKETNGTALLERIEGIIEKQQQYLVRLDQIKTLVKEATKAWTAPYQRTSYLKNLCEETASYHSIINKLYVNISQVESVRQFVELYDRVISQTSIDNVKVENLISDFNLLA